MIETGLPWYTRLLGSEPEGERFDQLLSEFKLSSEQARDARSRWYENENEGVSVFIGQGKIEAIQFYSAEHPDFDGFKGQLSLGLDFGMTRERVHERLGAPDNITPGRSIGPGLGHSGIDRYHADNCTVAVSYSTSSGRIEVLGFELKING